MKRNNVLIAIFLYIVAIYVLINSRSLPIESAKFPSRVAWILLGLNSIFLYQIITDKIKHKKRKDDIIPKKMWTIIGLSVVYIFTIEYFGYFLLTPIYILATMMALGVTNKKLAVIVTAVSMGFIFMGFKVLLHVPVPSGIFF